MRTADTRSWGVPALRARRVPNSRRRTAPNGPTHSFRRQDAAPLKPGGATRLTIALLPTSRRLCKGSRLRLAIAGANADHYAQVPPSRPPTLTLHHGGTMASRLDLPLRWEVS
jgi:hypothetical protein